MVVSRRARARRRGRRRQSARPVEPLESAAVQSLLVVLWGVVGVLGAVVEEEERGVVGACMGVRVYVDVLCCGVGHLSAS